MTQLRFRSARVFDGTNAECAEGMHVLVEERPRYHSMCACGVFNSICVMADGVDECLRAAREELRQGAHCIKLMDSGGVASPSNQLGLTAPTFMNIRQSHCV